MRWRVWCTVVLGLLARTAVAQVVTNPTFEIAPERDSATVGDSVRLHVRVQLDDRDLLLDSVPRLAGDAPRGMRVLAVERLTRQRDRRFAGDVVVAFYRTGRQEVPPLALSYRRNLAVIGASLRSDPVTVEIVPVLPGGSGQQLKDIKDLVAARRGDLVPIAIAAVLAAMLLVVGVSRWRRRRGRGTLVASQPMAEPVPVPDPLAAALERLRGIEREAWPARGEVRRHYEAVVAVLRDYLAASTDIPARASTTAELVAALPMSMTPDGTRERLRALLHEADLVKFARVRPQSADAERFLSGARVWLTGWAMNAVR